MFQEQLDHRNASGFRRRNQYGGIVLGHHIGLLHFDVETCPVVDEQFHHGDIAGFCCDGDQTVWVGSIERPSVKPERLLLMIDSLVKVCPVPDEYFHHGDIAGFCRNDGGKS